MLPFSEKIVKRFFFRTTGGTSSAKYCYSVWMRHLVLASQNKFDTIPNIVAELGPGDSLGIGLAALLSGSSRYYALDVVKYGSVEQNLKIFDDLIELFEKRTNIPDSQDLQRLKPILEDYSFPSHIVTDEILKVSLNKERLAKIRDDIKKLSQNNSKHHFLSYAVPWYNKANIQSNSVDYILSQSVLEYIPNVNFAIQQMKQWLKPNGLMSHQIDLGSMRTSETWDGHWTYTDLEWKIMKGKRPFFINRWQKSEYEKVLEDNDFRILFSQKNIAQPTVERKKLAKRFSNVSDDDLNTKGVFIISENI